MLEKVAVIIGISGCFLKWWVSPTNPWAFLLKMISTWGVLGIPPCKERPISDLWNVSSLANAACFFLNWFCLNPDGNCVRGFPLVEKPHCDSPHFWQRWILSSNQPSKQLPASGCFTEWSCYGHGILVQKDIWGTIWVMEIDGESSLPRNHRSWEKGAMYFPRFFASNLKQMVEVLGSENGFTRSFQRFFGIFTPKIGEEKPSPVRHLTYWCTNTYLTQKQTSSPRS